MKTKFMKDTAPMGRSAFSLFELAIVLVVMGLIAVISARAIPNLNMQSKAIELGAELRNYTDSVLGRAEAERYFLAPDNFTGFPHYDNYSDSSGNRWGYMVTRDMTSKSGLCALDPAQKIGIIYCKGTLAECRYESQIDSFVEDVAFLMFSSDATFKSRVQFVIGNVALNPTNYSLTPSGAVGLTTALSKTNFSNTSYNAIIMKIAAPSSTDPIDDTVLDFNYQEVWDRVGCPPLRSVTEGDVLSVRGASYQWVDTTYDFVPLPLNFLDKDGAEYCFESYEGVSTDFGLAQAYERDKWNGLESAYRSSGTGSGNNGSSDSAGMNTYADYSNYCNRGDNRMPTVTSCSGLRIQYNWLGDADADLPKWYKDAPVAMAINNIGVPQHRKWFFCGGNGTWNKISVGGRAIDLDDYQIRLRPGYRGRDFSDFRRINNRTFKAYARIPGSRALYRQAFSMSVRGTTFFYEYGWPLN
jgi:hypothetical protein